MKLLRIAAAIGLVAWLQRKYAAKVVAKAKGSGLHAPRLRVRHLDAPRSSGTRSSAASAASGAYRDDRDVAGVGALRDEEVTSR
jgi:hypothetical protein